MDSIRRFVANFRKHGTISWSSGKKVKDLKNIENNLTKEPEGKLFEDGIQKLNDDTIQDTKEHSENIYAFSPESIKNTNAQNTSPVDTDSNCSNTANISECLEEFNEILQEKHIDINTESVTLDEIDDVLNEMTEGNEETLSFNIPRFDLHDLVENFGIVFEQYDVEPTDYLEIHADENIEPIDIDDFLGPDNLDEDLEEAFDADKFLEKNIIIKKTENSIDFMEMKIELPDVISISSEDSQINEPNIQLMDVISISSEDSQVKEPIIQLMNDKEILETINIKLEQNNERDTPNELRNVFNELNNSGSPFQDEILVKDFEDLTPNKIDKKTNYADFKDSNERDFHSNSLMKGVIDENEAASGAMKIEGSDRLPHDIVNFYSENKIESTDVNNDPEITVKQNLNEEIKESKSQEAPFDWVHKYKKRDEPKIININPKKTINMIVENDNSYANNLQEIISINDSDETETESVHDKNHEKQELNTTKEIDSDDCGYLSSHFEFITEDEAKLDGLMNFNPNGTKKFNKHKKVKTIEISVDRYSNTFISSESSPEFMEDDPALCLSNEFELKPINLHRSDFAQNVTRDITNNVQENRPTALRSFRRNKNPHRYPISNCQNSMQRDLAPSDSSSTSPMQKNCTGSTDFTGYRPGENNIEENRPVQCDFGEYSQELHDLVRDNPGASNIERLNDLRDRPRPNILRGNCRGGNGPETSNDDIQRWRAFQKRRRNQFFLDQSYREYHLVPSNEDHHQLFNPNYLPPPNHSMRLENKSTLSIGTMMIEYDGVGFDMQMMRGNSESEEEEVKEEAAACARKILQMYPRENRKRRGRF